MTFLLWLELELVRRGDGRVAEEVVHFDCPDLVREGERSVYRGRRSKHRLPVVEVPPGHDPREPGHVFHRV